MRMKEGPLATPQEQFGNVYNQFKYAMAFDYVSACVRACMHVTETQTQGELIIAIWY